MGILGGALTKIAEFINSLASKIPSFNSDTGNLVSSIQTMNSVLDQANKVFPAISHAGVVLGLMVGIYIALTAFYFIQRAINLLRGAG